MKNILVVDDDLSICEALRVILEENGYSVDLAHTGAEAIDKSNQKVYNAALLDLKLPDIDGVELLTELKEGIPKMAKIIVTGNPTLDNAVRALNKGADAYIIKPFNPEELLLSIRKELEYQDGYLRVTQERVNEFIQERVMVLA